MPTRSNERRGDELYSVDPVSGQKVDRHLHDPLHADVDEEVGLRHSREIARARGMSEEKIARYFPPANRK
jgi:hypothetical protein